MSLLPFSSYPDLAEIIFYILPFPKIVFPDLPRKLPQRHRNSAKMVQSVQAILRIIIRIFQSSPNQEKEINVISLHVK
jgi:hypothetical protein